MDIITITHVFVYVRCVHYCILQDHTDSSTRYSTNTTHDTIHVCGALPCNTTWEVLLTLWSYVTYITGRGSDRK